MTTHNPDVRMLCIDISKTEGFVSGGPLCLPQAVLRDGWCLGRSETAPFKSNDHALRGLRQTARMASIRLDNMRLLPTAKLDSTLN